MIKTDGRLKGMTECQLTDSEINVEQIHGLLLPARGIRTTPRSAQVDEPDDVPRKCPSDRSEKNHELRAKQHHRGDPIDENRLE